MHGQITSSSAQMQAYHQCYLVYIPSCKGSSQTYLSFHKHYELKLEKPLHKHLHAGRRAENIHAFCTKRVSSSPLESLFFLFRNLALKSFPVLCFASLVPCTGSTPSQIIPLVLGQSGRGKRWQHRAGLSVCFYSITLLILPAIWHITDETGYCFRSLY